MRKDRKFRRKGVALLLSAAMLTTIIPLQMSVNAATEEFGQGITYRDQTVTLENYTYTANAGCSAITIQGNVTLLIKGTVTLKGGSATNAKGGGAGICVPKGSTLTLQADSDNYGGATLNVTGGAAQNGTNAGIYEYGRWNPLPVGKGGNGAGAGIGGVGASGRTPTADMDCGTVILEKGSDPLTVNATGGASGIGGEGSKGGQALAALAYMSVFTSYYVDNGEGGSGGGGGGLPGAAIGGGGGKGGNGGTGGSSTYSRSMNSLSSCGGSGGGGGGGGLSSGGGGGGGGAGISTGNKHGENTKQINQQGAVGGPAKSGGANSGTISYENDKATGGRGGKAGKSLQGGTGGSGGSGKTNGNSGGAGESAGACGKGGTLTVNQDTTLNAYGGGDPQNSSNQAPSIGSPDTRTGSEDAGSLVIKDGRVNISDSYHGSISDGTHSLYSVLLSLPVVEAGVLSVALLEQQGQSTTTDYTMLGTEKGVNLFLPEGSYEATVTAPAKAYPFTIQIKNGSVTVTENFEREDPLVMVNTDMQTITLTQESILSPRNCLVKMKNGTTKNYTYEDWITFTGYTKASMRIESGTQNVILKGYSRGAGDDQWESAIFVNPPSMLNLWIEGKNSLNAKNTRLCVPRNGEDVAKLTLSGSGSLGIGGARTGAAIGGLGLLGKEDTTPYTGCGRVTINSGTYTLDPGQRGTGIGGGNSRWTGTTSGYYTGGGDITINGGHITIPKPGNNPPCVAIGGSNGTLTMNGGTVLAYDGEIGKSGFKVTYNHGSIITDKAKKIESLAEAMKPVYIGGFTPDQKLTMLTDYDDTVVNDVYADKNGEVGIYLPKETAALRYLADGADGKTYSGTLSLDTSGNVTRKQNLPSGDGQFVSPKKSIAILKSGYIANCDYNKGTIVGGDYYSYTGDYRFSGTSDELMQTVFYSGKIQASFDNYTSLNDGWSKIYTNIMVKEPADVTMTMTGTNSFATDGFSGSWPALSVSGSLTMNGDGSTTFRCKDNSKNPAATMTGSFTLKSGTVTFSGGDEGRFSYTNIIEGSAKQIRVDGGQLIMQSPEKANYCFQTASFVQNGGYFYTPSALWTDEVTANGGVLTADGTISGMLLLNGGSVYNAGKLLTAATENEEPSYRAQIPLKETGLKQVLANERDLHITDRHTTTDDANRLYLYLPETAKYVQVWYNDGSSAFFMLRKESGQPEFTVTPYRTDLPEINLGVSGAEIIPVKIGSYTSSMWYNNTPYLGRNDYTITGKTTENKVTVGISNAVIHLKNANALASQGSALEFAGSASILLTGNNILKGGEGAAGLHVPTGKSVTIDTENAGTMDVAGGNGASAIGGNVLESGGSITIKGGSVSATAGGAADAIGSGSGASAECGKITLLGGSIRIRTEDGRKFSKTPLNGSGQELAQVVLTLDKNNPPALSPTGTSVTLDGVSYRIAAYHPGDNHLYLYVVKGNHTGKAGSFSFDITQLTTKVTGNGDLKLYLDDDTLSDWDIISGSVPSGVELHDGDMLAQGTVLVVYAQGSARFKQKDGIKPGRYLATQTAGGLKLVPQATYGLNDFTEQGWQSVWNADETDLQGWQRSAGTMKITVQTDGESAFRFTWGCQSGTLTGTVLINGQKVSKKSLNASMEEECIAFNGQGTNTIELQFTGTGTALVSPLSAAEVVPVNNVTAAFAEVITVTLKQPDFGNAIFLYQDQTGAVPLNDLELFQPGIQVWKDAGEMFARYQDPIGGNVFDYWTVSTAAGTVMPAENPLALAPTGDITLGVKTHLTPCYVIVIPETVALKDGGAATTTITASDLKNMQPGDTVDITIGGLNADGKAVLTRKGAANTLLVGVSGNSNQPLKNGNIAARFAHNNTSPIAGGTLRFAAPVGDKKAGEYTGAITFTIAYQTAGK